MFRFNSLMDQSRNKRFLGNGFKLLCMILAGFFLLIFNWNYLVPDLEIGKDDHRIGLGFEDRSDRSSSSSSCAMTESVKESLRVRTMIRDHFKRNGAARVRGLPSDQFCRQGFVLGRASESGFGNEMYKILTAAALSVMLNRSLIIGQSRGKFPFGNYISYNNLSFTLGEVKHLWRQNKCVSKHGRHLIMRVDDFEKPTETGVLCSDWREWKQPIIWFQGTTDAVAAQFFLTNIHPGMRKAASLLLGESNSFQSRPNTFGELMQVIVSPSKAVEEAVNWVLNSSTDPDVTLHMRLPMNKSTGAVEAALNCIKKSLHGYENRTTQPRVVLVSDTPLLIDDIKPKLKEFAEVLHFDHKLLRGNISNGVVGGSIYQPFDFRVEDWGPAPSWVAFVDFFLASRARHAVVSGAHRSVAATYAQLIAALAAARQLEDSCTASSFTFLSSFQRNLMSDDLTDQAGSGHVWNGSAGPLNCHHQPNQCALTPLLPPAWSSQSPIPRGIRRLQAYGIHLGDSGEVIESQLLSFCGSEEHAEKIITLI